jgi:hypothetical protein
VASKARFGRLPRTAPSLTSTIVSLAQQYQHQRDQNIEDAWKQGGLFEGKKVTDEAFLDHWRQRLASVSKDDPMWDYYNNLIYQYTFTIEESKMGQKYAEGTASDAQMAAFYRSWARKMPPDSQNYRQLMTQAAKFKGAATARGHGGRARASKDAYLRKQNETYMHDIRPWETLKSIISGFALGGVLGGAPGKGIIDYKDYMSADMGWGKLTNSTGENDPAAFAALLQDILADPAAHKTLLSIMKQVDPLFSGQLDDETLANYANRARDGYGIQLDRATKAGDKGAITAAKKGMTAASLEGAVVRMSLGPNDLKGFIDQNEFHRGRMDGVLAANSGASPTQRANAMADYANWLGGDGARLMVRSFPPGSFDPTSANFNPVATGMLARQTNTVTSLVTGQAVGFSLKDDLFGMSTEKPGAESDAVKLANQSAHLQSGLANVARGQSIIVRADPAGNVDADGNSWAIFSRNDHALDGLELVPFVSSSHGTVTVTDPKTKEPFVVGGQAGEIQYTVATPIKIAVYGAFDPNTRQGTLPLNPTLGSSDVIGWRVMAPGPNGTEAPLYGVWQNGKKVWTSVDPFATANRGSAGLDGHGNWVISYKTDQPMPPADLLGAPGVELPRWDPQYYVNRDLLKQNIGGIDSTDGKPWDPLTDKQMGWWSPLSAAAHVSKDAMDYTFGMGAIAVQNAERDWFSNPSNWTTEMDRMAQNGVPYENIIVSASQNLMQGVYASKTLGFYPEDQQATRRQVSTAQLSIAAGLHGQTNAQYTAELARQRDEGARQELVASLAKWGRETDVNPLVAAAQQRATGDPNTGTQAQAWIKKGWTVSELLNQPGMSLAQAGDLVFQITNGQSGAPLPPTTLTQQQAGASNQPFLTRAGAFGGRLDQTYVQPAANPFLTGGQIGAKPIVPVNPNLTPAYVQPKVVPPAVMTPTTGGLPEFLNVLPGFKQPSITRTPPPKATYTQGSGPHIAKNL